MVLTLDDKLAFAELAASLGLSVPDSHRITDPQQVEDFDFAARQATTTSSRASPTTRSTGST